MTNIGETTALIPQAGSSNAPEHLQDGGSGDTDFPFGNFKTLATVGERDPENGHVLTGYPDGHAAWLHDEDTIRVVYQSESYATLTSSEGETYNWVMDSGATFTGSHVHTIDYNREAFAEFLNNDSAASEMFEGAGHLFSTVYNVFGEEVTGKNTDPTDLGAKWGNQSLADGTVVEFDADQLLTDADWFFHSFCGAYYEQANKYGDGIGFEDDVYLMGEEWNIGQLFEEAAAAAGITEEDARLSPGSDFFTTTMGLASMVVDIENETAYTVPALGQSGYEKILPMNSGHEDYVVMVMAGYNLEVEPAPLMIYIGKKGVDEDGNSLSEDASQRDSFLGRNGLLYGQLYGMALDDMTYADIGINEIDADEFMMDAYAKDADAPETFSARYYPTSFRWDGFDTPENANETEVFLWEQDGDELPDGSFEPNEQPAGHTFFNGDSKTEHPAVDPDPNKHRYIQNLTVPSAQLGIEFTDIVNELENNDADGNGLPDYLSADVTRILAGVDGALTLETGGKGAAHIGPNNPDGTATHAIHVEDGEARMDQPDGLQWIKASDGDFLVVDEDSGNDYGERKFVLPIEENAEGNLQLQEEGKGYFLASAGGSLNPRAQAEVAAIPGTFSRATSSEFSGTWDVTHLVAKKENGDFYTQEEIAGTGAAQINSSIPLAEHTLMGVLQHRGESGGIIAERQADQGGQVFLFNIDLPESPKLVGFSSLPADTFAPGLPGGSGNEVENPTNGRETPFDNQPVQGFSGVQFAGEDTYWFLSDNGYGSKANSADYLLRIYEVDPNFTTEEGGSGEAQWTNFIQLADPNNLIPFEIEQEGTAERLLTGADFDIESFVLTPDGEIWVGEEFGPYLLKFDTTGTLLEAPIPTPNEIEFNTLNGQDPLVIGHRGASGDLPEHTLEAYALAIEQGADFVEPDLVITSDGVLIARHEPMLDDTTNVADVFGPERQSTKILDGQEVTAYFAEDFTLAEIKQLRAVQPRDFRDQSFNGQFEIPTLQEVIELVQDVEAQTGNQVGIYPETKHPTFFDEQGLSLEEPLIQTLQDTGFTDPSRIFIQSFEFQNLIELQGQLDAEGLGDIPLVQLYGRATDSANPNEPFSVPYDIRFNLEQGNDLAAIYGQDFLDAAENPLSLDTTYQDLDNAEFLQVISDSYAEGAGPWKNNFLLRESLDTPVDGDGDGVAEITSQLTGEVTSFVDDAHAAGLQVHPYTLRDEERFLTLNADGTPQTPEQEFQQLIEIGVDGFFTDFPETGAMEVAKLTQDFVASPDNPDVLAGNAIDNLRRSRGFEGMAYSPDYETLYPMLEGAVVGDPANAVRIYEFDVASGTYGSDIVGFYGLDDASHAIGDFTPINDTEFLVIERDGGQGDAAQFKKIFKVDFSEVDGEGFVEKEELVDLLNVADPNDLNGDGLQTFDFPFVTIEDVLVLDENTILVANDNNYPFSIGRGPDIDNNEIIKIELNESLDLDPRLGMPEDEPENPVVSGGNGDDNFDAVFSEDFDGNGQLLFTGGGDDQVNLSYAEGGNTVTTSSGDDTLFAWTGDRLDAGAGEDKIFLGAGGGGNLVTGGADADTFYLTQDDNLLPANPNTIGDFNQSEGDLLGFLATSLEFGSSDLNFTQDGANTIIEAFGQEVAILNGVNAASLTEQNFMFA